MTKTIKEILEGKDNVVMCLMKKQVTYGQACVAN